MPTASATSNQPPCWIGVLSATSLNVLVGSTSGKNAETAIAVAPTRISPRPRGFSEAASLTAPTLFGSADDSVVSNKSGAGGTGGGGGAATRVLGPIYAIPVCCPGVLGSGYQPGGADVIGHYLGCAGDGTRVFGRRRDLTAARSQKVRGAPYPAVSPGRQCPFADSFAAMSETPKRRTDRLTPEQHAGVATLATADAGAEGCASAACVPCRS